MPDTKEIQLTEKQYEKLKEFGFSPEKWTVEQASEIIGKIQENGWELPPELNPHEYEPNAQKEENVGQKEKDKPEFKSEFSRTTVSADMRAEIGKELLEKGIDFSSSLDETYGTATFNIRQKDIAVFNEIISSISTETSEKTDIKEDIEVNAKPEITIASGNEKEKLDLDEAIQIFDRLHDKINDDLKDYDTSFINNSIKNAVTALENNTVKTENISRNENKDIPIDLGKRVSPVFSAAISATEHRIKSLSDKNATRQNKIIRNQSKIEKLSEKAASLKQANNLLYAMKKNAPLSNNIADIIIEKNNKKIEKINNVKIPKRENKIEKHNRKIEKNDKKLAKTMSRFKILGAMNRFLVGNMAEKRAEIVSLLTTMAQFSLDNSEIKRNKAIEQLKSISQDFISSDKITIDSLADKHKDINNLSAAIAKSHQKAVKAMSFLDDLDKVRKGEVLNRDEDIQNIVENTEKSIVEAVTEAPVNDDMSIDIITDNIVDEVVDNMADRVKNAIEHTAENTKEVEMENDTRQSLISIEQNGESRYYINNDSSLSDIAKVLSESERPYVDIANCGVSISEIEYAEIQQSDNFALSIDINMDEGLVSICEVDGRIPDPERDDNNTIWTEISIDTLVDVINNPDYTDKENALRSVAGLPEISKVSEVLIREERSVEPDKSVNREDEIMKEIAAATGYSNSQLSSLPKDIKADLIAEYEVSGGQINTSAFTSEIANILNVTAEKTRNEQSVANTVNEKDKKRDSMKSVEELVESNANNIDGIINNERPEQSNEREKPKARFSLKDLHSSKYAPRSRQPEAERDEQNKSKGRDNSCL